MDLDTLKDFLNEKVNQYNSPEFIDTDPIIIPHQYSLKQDIEVSSFITATIAWGNRKMIIANASKLMDAMGDSPFDFVMNHRYTDLEKLDWFVHRTFNHVDLKYFIQSIRNIYLNHGGFEEVFSTYTTNSTQPAITEFKKIFFELPHEKRTLKHVSDPLKGSAAKRLNMWLRWLVRKDNNGVDFGIWNRISPASLSCPLDVHSGNVARKLKLVKRNQNDFKAVLELDKNLRRFDSADPVKYDFALFGLGVFEKF